jgi:predicted GIY-YIG superfamily endonuclease
MNKKPSIDLSKNRLNYIYFLMKGDTPFYVGKTHNVKRREAEHKQTYGDDIELRVVKAIKEDDWKKHEQEWIKKLKEWNIELSNKNPGGGGPQKGIPRSQEFKDKISQSKLGVPRPKDEVIPATLVKQKPVQQFDKNGNFIKEYPSAKLAADAVKIHHNNMYDHLKGKYKTIKGYIFKYKN